MILKTIKTFPPIAAAVLVGGVVSVLVVGIVGMVGVVVPIIVVGVVVMAVVIVCIFFNLNTENNGHMLHLIKYLQ